MTRSVTLHPKPDFMYIVGDGIYEQAPPLLYLIILVRRKLGEIWLAQDGEWQNKREDRVVLPYVVYDCHSPSPFTQIECEENLVRCVRFEIR